MAEKLIKIEDIMKRLGWYLLKPDGVVDIGIHNTSLNQESFDEFTRVVGITAELRPIVVDYLSLVEEFNELSRAEMDISRSIQNVPNPVVWVGAKMTFAYVKAQRAISNFLSAASAFRDRTLTRLSEAYGKNSREFCVFNSAIKDAYDSSFAYRALYNLRNYSQHHDSPLSLLPVNGSRDNFDGLMKISVKIMLQWNDMLKSSRIQKKFLLEIKERSEPKIELIGLAHDYMLQHSNLMHKIISLHINRLDEMHEYAQVIMSVGCIPKGATPVIWEDTGRDASDEKSKNKMFHHFSFDELFYVISLYECIGEGNFAPEVSLKI
ncbi:hypothetical protein SAE02_36000 [Skermanella aerolata]|uniref:Uncharacterized protein n=1 Tax=Skermanella aerolata TaxID=393310 RepID=A0A512DSK0_9PROT|nr:hypothetical protein [Skermanella aerolata]GEO39452.1 hypothetical protein SAE02_36000 [Skermanella aerolata]